VKVLAFRDATTFYARLYNREEADRAEKLKRFLSELVGSTKPYDGELKVGSCVLVQVDQGTQELKRAAVTRLLPQGRLEVLLIDEGHARNVSSDAVHCFPHAHLKVVSETQPLAFTCRLCQVTPSPVFHHLMDKEERTKLLAGVRENFPAPISATIFGIVGDVVRIDCQALRRHLVGRGICVLAEEEIESRRSHSTWFRLVERAKGAASKRLVHSHKLFHLTILHGVECLTTSLIELQCPCHKSQILYFPIVS
jgi:hypothetical protein